MQQALKGSRLRKYETSEKRNISNDQRNYLWTTAREPLIRHPGSMTKINHSRHRSTNITHKKTTLKCNSPGTSLSATGENDDRWMGGMLDINECIRNDACQTTKQTKNRGRNSQRKQQ
jgi:hypothetical protein